MMKKILSVFLVLVLTFSGLVSNANAQEPFRIADLDINGTDMSDVDALYVERGEDLNIRVEVDTNNEIADAWPIGVEYIDGLKVRAEIYGYEYEDIEDVSDVFKLGYQDRRVEYMKLSIPEDIDASKDYELRIKVYNGDYSLEQFYTLRIEAPRHLLNIKDVIFTPGLSLNVDQPLFASVRIENLGDKDEEDIKVEVSVPQLGKSGITYIDELVKNEDDNNNRDDYQTSESSDSIYLDLRGAQPGTYDLIVKVEYNRGHDELTKDYKLVIGGGATSGAVQETLIVDAAEKIKTSEAGQGVVYKIDIANMGNTARSFTAEVTGLDWGNYRVDPSIAIVQPGSTGELFVYVSSNEDVIGQRTFTVNVKEGNNVVKQISFQANVAEAKDSWDNVLSGLQIGFIILLVILVILGIILAATKMGKKNSDEPLGEGYY